MEQMNENIVRKGTFRCYNKAQNVCGTFFAAGLLMLAAVTVLCIFDFGEVSEYLSRLFWVVVLLEVTAAVTWIVVSMRGDYSYEIRENEFSVTAPNGDTEYFFYGDIQSVDYEPLNKGRDKGYTVLITTSVRKVKYQFVFGYNAENTDSSATPFYYLEVRAGLREEVAEEIDKDGIMKQFERMSREQNASRLPKAEREARFFDSITQEKQKLEAARTAEQSEQQSAERNDEE